MLKYSAIQQGWSMITIATLNCNGFKACVRKGFWTWFDQKDIDIVCLQEVRCAQTEFSGSVAPKEGWHWAQVDAEEKGYSSVAIWSKRKPQRVFTSIGLEWADKEGRAVGMEFENSIVWSVYFPSGTSGAERQAKKDEFLIHMTTLMEQWTQLGKKVVLCGDINIAHTALDIFHDKTNAKTSGFLPHERQWVTDILSNGWQDSMRQVLPDMEIYSWWTTRSKTAREKNVGWRIDYHFATSAWKPMQATVDKEPPISDHAPVVIGYDNIL